MSPDLAVVGSANRLGWVRADSRTARLALIAAAVAVVVEAAHFLLRWPGSLWIGGLPVSPSVIPIAVAGLAGGARSLGRPRSAHAGLACWLLLAVGLVAGAVSVVSGRSPASVLALVLVGLDEEFVYRGALPAVAAFGLGLAGFDRVRAGIGGLIIGGACFVVLPGHVAQWNSQADAAPFVAFAVLSALAVWRTGALVEVAMFHAVVNIVNIDRLASRGSGAAIMLAGLGLMLVVAYVPPLHRRDLIIDLTDPDEPQVYRAASVGSAGLASLTSEPLALPARTKRPRVTIDPAREPVPVLAIDPP